mmetsp:Transcript_30855/g.72082  ORF Transcript_30855/g.72082 Transcript_30855/m.72082 type:complete len:217 (-) Transcript_30855:452-1102(-)
MPRAVLSLFDASQALLDALVRLGLQPQPLRRVLGPPRRLCEVCLVLNLPEQAGRLLERLDRLLQPQPLPHYPRPVVAQWVVRRRVPAVGDPGRVALADRLPPEDDDALELGVDTVRGEGGVPLLHGHAGSLLHSLPLLGAPGIVSAQRIVDRVFDGEEELGCAEEIGDRVGEPKGVELWAERVALRWDICACCILLVLQKHLFGAPHQLLGFALAL